MIVFDVCSECYKDYKKQHWNIMRHLHPDWLDENGNLKIGFKIDGKFTAFKSHCVVIEKDVKLCYFHLLQYAEEIASKDLHKVMPVPVMME